MFLLLDQRTNYYYNFVIVDIAKNWGIGEMNNILNAVYKVFPEENVTTSCKETSYSQTSARLPSGCALDRESVPQQSAQPER